MRNEDQIIILGVDALDFETVYDLGLGNLKQARCKKLAIPPECYKDGQPYSPYCWESILTGRPAQASLGVYESIYRNPALEWLYKRMGKYLRFIPGKKRLLESVGFELDTAEKERLILRDTNTLFDLSENTEDFNVFHYSYGFVFNPYARLKDFDEQRRKMLLYAKAELELVMAWLTSRRDQDLDIIMTYTRVLDWYGHYHYGKDVYYDFYMVLDKFVGGLSDGLEGTLIIISDHGMVADEKGIGTHTDTAFFSINRLYTRSPGSIDGLYHLVEGLMK